MNDVPAALGLSSDKIAGLLASAGRAPSLHNSQPWRFRVEPDVIELWADPERRLSAADPTGREQRLACGAALYNLRLALHGQGIRPMVTVQPDPQRPDLLACIRYGGHKTPTPSQLRLLAAVPHRRTNRRPFADEPVDTRDLAALRRAALEEGAWLHFVDDRAQRDALQRLAARAHTVQQADPSFRAEIACWTAVSDTSDDGVPAHQGERRPAAHERWVTRDFTDWAGSPTPTEVGFEHEPTLAVLSAFLFGSSADVSCGQAMQHVLLTATADGLATSFLSHVIEVDQTRDELRRLLHAVNPPQVLLRIGHGWPVPATPRRAVGDLLFTDATPTDRTTRCRPGRTDSLLPPTRSTTTLESSPS